MTDKEKIIAYIDKLLGKYPKNYYLLTVAEFIDSLQEEPVSEDLEKSAKKYGTKKHPMTKTGANESAYDFKAGAKWQKEQDEETLKDRIINAYNRGMEQMKKQMMAEAFDLEVKVDAGGYPHIDKTIELYDYDNDIPLAKEGDKVKVIVIKGE